MIGSSFHVPRLAGRMASVSIRSSGSRVGVLGVLTLLALGPGGAAAQAGAVRGTVRSGADSSGLAGVRVILNNDTRVLSDPQGAFVLSGVQAGTNMVVFRRIGYEELETAVWMAPGDSVVELVVTLNPVPVQLEEVTVEADAPVRNLERQGFYERKKEGFGHFLERSDIERRHPQVVTDLLRRFSRRYRQPRCLVLDGVLVAESAAARQVNRMVLPQDIEAIEIYGGAASLPLRFHASRCSGSVLVVWTR